MLSWYNTDSHLSCSLPDGRDVLLQCTLLSLRVLSFPDGAMIRVLTILHDLEIEALVFSSYDADYVFLQSECSKTAVQALLKEGYNIISGKDEL